MSNRKRLAPEESKRIALEAARDQLIESGPQSVTLKAVAARIGRTHANLLHHFGSAAGLQKELAGYLARTVCDDIADAARARREGNATPVDLVNMTFDAFVDGRAGALASWILLNGNEESALPIVAAINDLVVEFVPDEIGQPEDQKIVHTLTHTLVLLAMGDALMGRMLSETLGVPRSAPRTTMGRILGAIIQERDEAGLRAP